MSTLEERGISREGREWLEKLMRLGFLAKGVVYITVGILAVQLALGDGGEATGAQGALAEIGQQPFGQVLLGIIAVGLVGLTLWYFVRGGRDTDNEGDDASGLAKRAAYIAAGVGYGLLALVAFQILLGSGSGGNGNTIASWTAQIMQESWGRWLVAAAGLVVIGVGLYQFYRAYRARFRHKLRTHEMSRTEIKGGTWAGQFGIAARGVVVIVVGVFLLQAALQYDPQQAGGLGQALQALAQQPYGPWVLGIVALGLVAYGLFTAVVQTRYRRIQV